MNRKLILLGIFIVFSLLLVALEPGAPRDSRAVNTPYLKGVFTFDSFLFNNHQDFVLNYAHRYSDQLLQLSPLGELLNSIAVSKAKKEGIHLGIWRDNEVFSIIQARGIEKSSPSSERLWYKNISAHHDLAFDDQGNIFTFDIKHKNYQLEGEKVSLFADDLVLLSPTGNEIKRISLYPHLTPYLTEHQKRVAIETWSKKEKHDIFHLNSMTRIRENLPGFASKGDLLISVRDSNLLIVFSWKKQRVIWDSEGIPLDQQHHATITKAGEILVFDNGVSRKASRLLKIDPIQKEIVWRYEPATEKFFTRRHGSVQELPDGSLLAGLGRKGTVYEISRDGQVRAELRLKMPGKKHFDAYRVKLIKRFAQQ